MEWKSLNAYSVNNDDGVGCHYDDVVSINDNTYDGQVCLLGTGDIDRRRSCVSDGGFRLIVTGSKLNLMNPDQGSTDERSGGACLLSGNWATSGNQVNPGGRGSQVKTHNGCFLIFDHLKDCLSGP